MCSRQLHRCFRSGSPMAVSQWLGNVKSFVSDYVGRPVANVQVPKWIIYPSLTAGACLASGALVWYSKPSYIMQCVAGYKLGAAGLKVRFCKGEQLTYCYAERGTPDPSKPSLLLLHGSLESKHFWLQVSEFIPRDFHIILLDLPGHGMSSTPELPEGASLFKLIDYIHEFAELMGLTSRTFHLVGHSLGGALAGLYAGKYSSDIDRVTLVVPVLQCPIETDAFQEFQEGRLSMLTDSVEELQRLAQLSVYNEDLLPKSKQVYKGILQIRKPKQRFNEALCDVVRQETGDDSEHYEQELGKNGRPTQIIWPAEDQFFHVSGGHLLREMLSDCWRLEIVQECGHAIQIEKPAYLAELILDFHSATRSPKDQNRDSGDSM